MKLTQEDLKQLIDKEPESLVEALEIAFDYDRVFSSAFLYSSAISPFETIKEALKPKPKPVSLDFLVGSPFDCLISFDGEEQSIRNIGDYDTVDAKEIVRCSCFTTVKPRMNHPHSVALWESENDMIIFSNAAMDAGFRVEFFRMHGRPCGVSITGVRDGFTDESDQ